MEKRNSSTYKVEVTVELNWNLQDLEFHGIDISLITFGLKQNGLQKSRVVTNVNMLDFVSDAKQMFLIKGFGSGTFEMWLNRKVKGNQYLLHIYMT